MRFFWIVLIFTALVSPCLPAVNVHALSETPRIKLSVKPLNLSTTPGLNELMAAGQLGGQLHPVHESIDDKKKDQDNLSFGRAIEAWNRHEYKKAVKLFKNHVVDFPESPWAAEAVLHVGCDARYNGRYTEAEESFNWIIEKTAASEYYGARMLKNKARSRLAVLKVFENNLSQAMELFSQIKKESPDWRHRTYASHWIQRLSRYKANELSLLNCGTQALASLLQKKKGVKSAVDFSKSKKKANQKPKADFSPFA